MSDDQKVPAYGAGTLHTELSLRLVGKSGAVLNEYHETRAPDYYRHVVRLIAEDEMKSQESQAYASESKAGTPLTVERVMCVIREHLEDAVVHDGESRELIALIEEDLRSTPANAACTQQEPWIYEQRFTPKLEAALRKAIRELRMDGGCHTPESEAIARFFHNGEGLNDTSALSTEGERGCVDCGSKTPPAPNCPTPKSCNAIANERVRFLETVLATHADCVTIIPDPNREDVEKLNERIRLREQLIEAADISLHQRFREFVDEHGRNGSKTGRADYTKMITLDKIEALRIALDEYDRVRRGHAFESSPLLETDRGSAE
jgi:hypothetical protein